MARVISTVRYPSADTLPSAANFNQTRNGSLTDPEAQILHLLKAGKERTAIAAEVGADEAAVKEHIKAILRKAVGPQARGVIRRKLYASYQEPSVRLWTNEFPAN